MLVGESLINTRFVSNCINNDYVDMIRFIYDNDGYKGYIPVWASRSLEMYDILVKMSTDNMNTILYEIIEEDKYDLFRDIIRYRNITIDHHLIRDIKSIRNRTAELARDIHTPDV